MSITVCSVSPEPYTIKRLYMPALLVPAAPTGGYSSVVINDAVDHKVFWQSLSEKEVVPFDVTAKDIVADIFAADQLEGKGFFALPNGRTEPTAKELSTARLKRIEQLQAWAGEGDRLYSQFGDRGIQHIPDVSKRAVRELGEDRPWVMQVAHAKVECPVCGEMLKRLSNGNPPAICKSCNSILDPERVAAHAPEEKRKPGRPKREVMTETASA